MLKIAVLSIVTILSLIEYLDLCYLVHGAVLPGEANQLSASQEIPHI
jgi:hypothetical protein